MSGNYGIIINFLIYSQFGAIRRLNSRWAVHNSSFFMNNNLYLTDAENRTNTGLILLLWKRGGYFCLKLLTFCKKCWHQQNLGGLGTIYFLNLDMCLYVRTKFQVSSIILTSFTLPPTSKRTLKIPQDALKTFFEAMQSAKVSIHWLFLSISEQLHTTSKLTKN